jgi:hypothetical protein
MCEGTFQKTTLPGRHVIESSDAVAGGEQPVDHITANKAGSPGN